MNKQEKKNLYLSLLEISELLCLSLSMIFFYTIGLNIVVYVIFIGVIPFILTIMSFYPAMDLFGRKRNISKLELFELLFFFVIVAYYIACLFLCY
jgi:hypothetical protein